jgi:hypothetical protein
MKRDDVIAVVKGTRDYVAAGWVQKAFCAPHGMCLMQALRLATKDHLGVSAEPVIPNRVFDALFNAAAGAIREHLSEGFGWLIQFNDDDHTTQGDVMMVCEKTLADLGGAA